MNSFFALAVYFILVTASIVMILKDKMRWFDALFIIPSLFLLLFISGCAHEKIIYKCPPGQVLILEDAGQPTEAKRCYTPGVRYYDMRPDTTKKLDHWKEKENK